MKEKLRLNPGDELRRDSSSVKGFMGETDVTNYSILDAAGNIVGTVEYTEHMAVKGFRVTNSIVQKDLEGNVLVKTSWQGNRDGA
jgi:hypothetical protein